MNDDYLDFEEEDSFDADFGEYIEDDEEDDYYDNSREI